MNIDDLMVMLDAMESLDDRESIREGLGQIGAAQEGAQARIAELEQSLVDAEERYKNTAARNWELSQAVTASDAPANDANTEAPVEDVSFDDLFEER